VSGGELIQVGDTAPDFELPASDGKTYRLSSVLEHAHVALVFYPGNNTPG
jgi:peroxiredoxin Q/BCP